MINIQDKKDCCGCSACASVCPKQCITMSEDSEGFIYPCVDESVCVDCHLCEKVCPIINYGNDREPLAVYAAKNPDESIRMQSSSGGVLHCWQNVLLMKEALCSVQHLMTDGR